MSAENQCRKKETGSCFGCQAYKDFKNWLHLGVKYQQALNLIKNNGCNSGSEPSMTFKKNKDYLIETITLEDEAIEPRR